MMTKLEEIMMMTAMISGAGRRSERTLSTGHDVPAHIQRKARKNAKANKVAKASRKRNR